MKLHAEAPKSPIIENVVNEDHDKDENIESDAEIEIVTDTKRNGVHVDDIKVYRIYVMLFNKYIEKYKADLEINISYPIQMSLAKKYHDINGKLADGDNDDMELNKLWYDLVMKRESILS